MVEVVSAAVHDCVVATAPQIQAIGRQWMQAPQVVAKGSDLGLSPDQPMDFWLNGRAGVLGEVSVDQAAAALAFVGRPLVRRLWGGRPAVIGARGVAEAYGRAAAAWGRDAFSSVAESDAEEMAALCRRVVDGADPATGQLFAGWREMPWPDDPLGGATVGMNVVRELRGGAHIHAVFAVGLTPLQAIISVDHPVYGGPQRAKRFGWVEPYPVPDPAARARAEELTSTVVASVYARSFSDADADRFTELVATFWAAIEGSGSGS